jgi:hypothetical protein
MRLWSAAPLWCQLAFNLSEQLRLEVETALLGEERYAALNVRRMDMSRNALIYPQCFRVRVTILAIHASADEYSVGFERPRETRAREGSAH